MFYILNAISFSVLQPGWQLCGSLGSFFLLSSPSWLSGLWKTSPNPAPLSPAFRICCLPIIEDSVYLWGVLFFLLPCSQPLAGHYWALCECLGTWSVGFLSVLLPYILPWLENSSEFPEWSGRISLNSSFVLTSFNIRLSHTHLGI